MLVAAVFIAKKKKCEVVVCEHCGSSAEYLMKMRFAILDVLCSV